MSLHRKWLFYLAGLVCIALAIAGGILYPPTSWGILTPILYVSVIVFCTTGILYLIYRKGFPGQ
ncbi:MAG: hypothetical protein ACXACG_08695 [Candidatus Thorarchaeota archaeon]